MDVDASVHPPLDRIHQLVVMVLFQHNQHLLDHHKQYELDQTIIQLDIHVVQQHRLNIERMYDMLLDHQQHHHD